MLSLSKKGIFTGLWMIIAAVILIIGFASSISRLMLANLNHYQTNISQWLSQQLGHPIEFEQLTATWHYFQPQFHIRRLVIYDRLHEQPLLYVKRLDLGVDLWRSLWKNELIPADVNVVGTQVHLRPGMNGRMHVNDLVVLDPGTPFTVLEYRLLRLQSWLLSPGNKSLRDIKVTWEGDDLLGKNGVVINLDVRKKLRGKRIVFQVHQADVASVLLEGSAVIRGDSLQVLSTSKGSLSVRAFMAKLPSNWLAQYFPAWHGQAETAQLLGWVNWHGVSLDAIQTQVSFSKAILKNVDKGKVVQSDDFRLHYAWQAHPRSHKLHCSSPLKCGVVKVSANNIEITDPSVWRQPIQLQHLDDLLGWQAQKDGSLLYIPEYSIDVRNKKTDKVGALKGYAKIFFPHNFQNPELDLVSNFDFDVTKFAQYMPANVMDSDLVKWLDHAFKRGEIDKGRLVVRGPLKQFPFEHHEGRFSVEANVRNILLHYKDHWPEIAVKTGRIDFDTRSMFIKSHDVDVTKNKATNVSAKITDLTHPFLEVHGNIVGDLSHSMSFINHSPLSKTVGRELHAMQLTGPMEVDLHLGIPLYDTPDDDIDVSGHVKFNNDLVHFPQWLVDLKQLKGKLFFTADKINADNLAANIHQVPIHMSMHTAKNHQPNFTEVNVQSEVTAKDLQKQFHWPILSLLSGKTAVDATLHLHQVDDVTPNTVYLKTNLHGLMVDLPAPFAKTAIAMRPLQVKAEIHRGEASSVAFDYDHTMQATFAMSNEPGSFKFLGANFYFGEALKGFGNLDMQPENSTGITAKGDLLDVNWQEWYRIFNDFSSTNSVKSMAGLYPSFDINIGNLTFFDTIFKHIHVQLMSDQTGWLVQFANEDVDGETFIPQGFPKEAITVSCKHWYIKKSENAFSFNFLPKDVPPLNVMIRDLRYGDMELNKVVLSVTPETDVLRINQISAAVGPMQLHAMGHWQVVGHKQLTKIKGSVAGKNLGIALQKMGWTDSLLGGQGRLMFSLNWRDGLLPPDGDKINGTVHFNFADGEIARLSEQTRAKLGFARLLNLLSLQSLPRRLMLDFRDLNQQGFDFSELHGDFNLHAGNAYTDNTVMKGGNGTVQMLGRIGLAAHDYNVRLLITPHVTSSLPVVATIAGGPVAGIAAWVAEKIYSGTAEKATRVSYHVTGNWHNPRIETH